jgi:hypothetical protein
METSDGVFDVNQPSTWAGFFLRLFANDFMPHGHCYFWRTDILWLHVISDAVITLSYYAIPILLIYFVVKKKGMPFSWMFMLFGAFIFLCGTTHLFAIITVWKPIYRLDGLVKLLTGVVSFVTALVLIPIIPKVIAFPNMAAMIEALTNKTNELVETNKNLERFNQATLGREKRIVELKKEVNALMVRLKEKPPYTEA